MSIPSWAKRIYRRVREQFLRIPETPRSLIVSALFLCGAYLASGILINHTGGENNSALVFVLAVVMISLLTEGYAYGIVSSIIGGFCINFFFMVPYAAFSLSYAGYPVAMISMVAISCVVCALTTRTKNQRAEAIRQEKRTKSLYELNERLNAEKAAIQLESARETIRGNILRAVSHDLRTPLTAISGAAAVLLEEEGRPERDVSLLSDIKSDADALITMVENLLSVTRIQGEGAQIKKQSEVLEEVAGDAVQKIRRRFPEARVALALPEDVLLVPMDPLLIRQVIFNLLENAVRHSGAPEGITLGLFRRENWAVTEVTDRGRGLSPEALEAVRTGRPLSAATSGDASRGMGIGLSVCRSIITAHGGFFEAENLPQGGALFRFGLPLEEEETA